MSLPHHPIAGPDRPRQGTMGHKVEAGPERIRHHIPRPYPDNMITHQIRSTVYPSANMRRPGGLAPPFPVPWWLLSVVRSAGPRGFTGLA
jgi:hypothetical protein